MKFEEAVDVRSPKEPSYHVRAFAGPMSPHEVRICPMNFCPALMQKIFVCRKIMLGSPILGTCVSQALQQITENRLSQLEAKLRTRSSPFLYYCRRDRELQRQKRWKWLALVVQFGFKLTLKMATE